LIRNTPLGLKRRSVAISIAPRIRTCRLDSRLNCSPRFVSETLRVVRMKETHTQPLFQTCTALLKAVADMPSSTARAGTRWCLATAKTASSLNETLICALSWIS